MPARHNQHISIFHSKINPLLLLTKRKEHVTKHAKPDFLKMKLVMMRWREFLSVKSFFSSYLLIVMYTNASVFLLQESEFVYNWIKIAGYWFFLTLLFWLLFWAAKMNAKQTKKQPPEYRGSMPISSLLLSCTVIYSSAPLWRLILVYKTSEYVL